MALHVSSYPGTFASPGFTADDASGWLKAGRGYDVLIGGDARCVLVGYALIPKLAVAKALAIAIAMSSSADEALGCADEAHGNRFRI